MDGGTGCKLGESTTDNVVRLTLLYDGYREYVTHTGATRSGGCRWLDQGPYRNGRINSTTLGRHDPAGFFCLEKRRTADPSQLL